ncbi:MAG: carboxy terminal-processing peptidase, partial [Myxococcota bacterium]
MKFKSVLLITIVAAALATTLGCQSKQTPNEPAAATDPAAQTSTGESKTTVQMADRQLVREQALGEILVELLEKQHLLRKTIDDDLSEKAWASYVDLLDPGKSFLLKAQVDSLKTHQKRIDDQIRAGDFALAIEGAKLYNDQVGMVKKIVEAQLAKPFDLTRDESLEIDGDKRSWCTSEDELRERWRLVLKYQVLQRIARLEEQAKARAEMKKSEEVEEVPGDPIPESLEGREKYAREKMAKDYSARFARLEQQGHIEAMDQFLNAITSVYDPHSAYLPPARKENFDIQMSGRLEGIGAVLSVREHYVEVVRIVPGSASWRQGELEAADTILMVSQASADPVDVVDMPLNDVVRMIRGKKGTVVKLTVKKPDGRLKTIPITRDVVQIEASYAKGAILKHPTTGERVGYIDVPSFYGNSNARPGVPERSSSNDVRRLLELYTRQKVDAVILDLRSNGGGYLNDARKMAGLFFDEGPVVQTRASNGYKRVLEDDDPSVVWGGRVVVMVNSFSASASEIVAGALQDYDRAVVVGTEHTHGKGTVQMIVNLDRYADDPRYRKVMPLGVLKLTEQQFFRVSGASTQNRGVVPDIVLPNPAGHIESGERHLDYAIPWSSVSKVDFKAWSKPLDRTALVNASKKRTLDNPAFDLVRRRTAVLKARQKDTTVQLNFKT